LKGKKTGGRTKGTPNKATAQKDEVREALRQYLTDQITPVADALLSRARGVRYFVTRHKRTGKYEIVTDPEAVVAALNGEDDKTGEFYTDKPDVMQACAGPGKTAVLAWCGWNFMACYANGGTPEGRRRLDHLRQPRRQPLARAREVADALAVPATKRSPGRRRASSRTTIPKRGSSRRGPGRRARRRTSRARRCPACTRNSCCSVIDESGAIPTTVLRAAEQALSNCEFGKILQAGNPISLEGMLYAAATQLAHQWHIIRVTGDPDDPKRSPRIDLEWARHQIDLRPDNPWVMSYILGSSRRRRSIRCSGPEEVQAAMRRELPATAYNWAQARLGVDVARYGDDRTVIFPRQGKRAFPPTSCGTRATPRCRPTSRRWCSRRGRVRQRVATVMDATGRLGGRRARRALRGDPESHRRSTCSSTRRPRPAVQESPRRDVVQMAEWVKAGGWLPNLPSWSPSCRRRRTRSSAASFRSKPKDQVKARLGRSPDLADALALTFGVPEERLLALLRSLVSSQPTAPVVDRSSEDFSHFMGTYAILMAKVRHAAIQSVLEQRRDRVCSGRERMAC
jgi:phage terminase large subunit